MDKTFYITTTAAYVNAKPHIGFALEIVAADVLARFKRMQGCDVVFVTGTDEHGLKIYRGALEEELEPQEYANKYSANFQKLSTLLNLSVTHFGRTTDPNHTKAAQEFWKLCDLNEDIYKKEYKVKYCVGCELEKTESELVDGECPIHPGKELELIEEENYFFRFSRYQERLLDLYEQNPDFVLPHGKLKEITSFVERGLQDFSISRLKSKMPWGIPVPGDDEHVMYVWFDALIYYISTIGWPADMISFEKYWPGMQIAGKDNLRQQSAMWQAMLMSAGLPNTKQILINGFISVEGQKMSKSLGNVIDPKELVDRFGVDASRFLLLQLGPVSGDIDLQEDQFEKNYESFLANSLGNTVQRVATLCAKSGMWFASDNPPGFRSQVTKQMKMYRFDLALEEIWKTIAMLEKRIDDTQPWKLEGKKLQVTLMEMVAHLRQVGFELQPFMPETAEKILEIFKGPEIAKPTPLFPRLETKKDL